MRINNEFTVHAPIDRAWALLTDVEAIAPCMPGAQLTGIRPVETDSAGDTSPGEIYEGKVKVKLGPVVAEYKGTAVFIEKDDVNYHGVIDAKGRDSRGAGNASAMITVQLRPEGEGTTVGIDTELKISGKIAQFGAGMIQEVSEKLLGQFVGCLEGKLAAPAESEPTPATTAAPTSDQPVVPAAATGAIQPEVPAPTIVATSPEPVEGTPAIVPVDAALPSTIAPATAPPAPASPSPATDTPTSSPTAPPAPASTTAGSPTTAPTAPPAPASSATEAPTTAPTARPGEPARRTFQASPEPEALDLLDLAGGAAFKRLLPVVIAGAAVVAAVIFFLTRR